VRLATPVATPPGGRIALEVAARLETVAGPVARALFLAGFWCTVFTAMLGVWQGVPQVYADVAAAWRGRAADATRDRPVFLAALAWLALPPLVLLWFRQPVALVLAFSVVGAFIMPFLAAKLAERLLGQAEFVGSDDLLVIDDIQHGLDVLTITEHLDLRERLGEHLPPLSLNLYKNLLVLAALLPLIAIWHGFSPPRLTATEVAICLASGLIGIGIADTLYFRALNRVGAGRMGIVGNCYSPFVILLAYLFLDERLSAMQLAGFALVTAGVLVIHEPQCDRSVSRRELAMGLATGVVAVLLMAVAIVMVKRILEHADLLWVSAIRMAGGVGGMLVIAVILRQGLGTRGEPLDRRGWTMLVVAAMVGQLLSMLLWLGGYKYTSASVASILNETASIFILLFAWIFLREPIGPRKLLGVACTFGGVGVMLL